MSAIQHINKEVASSNLRGDGILGHKTAIGGGKKEKIGRIKKMGTGSG